MRTRRGREPHTRVLVIEDEEGVRASFRMILAHLGMDGDFAESGVEALEKLAEGSFDAILLDYHLRGVVDGSQILIELDSERPEVLRQVIVCTGNPERAIVHPVVVRERIPVLPKPFSSKDLRDAVEALAANRA